MSGQSSDAPSLLIVDDDPRVLELTEFAARGSHLFGSIRTASNGAVALAVLGNGEARPDVILTDLSMPIMNGFELVLMLKQRDETKDIPVVMFSSSGLPYDRERAMTAGCRAFYPKPTSLAGLNEVVAGVAAAAAAKAA
jgi:CheY-like chemotaxis protein